VLFVVVSVAVVSDVGGGVFLMLLLLLLVLFLLFSCCFCICFFCFCLFFVVQTVIPSGFPPSPCAPLLDTHRMLLT